MTTWMRKAANSTARLGRVKAPYIKNAEVIRAKMLPEGMYGCETCPVNEGAMRTWRSKPASALTYVTSRRALGLTFAAASHGKDTDPEVHLYIPHVIVFRRALYVQNENSEIICNILKIHRDKGEPGNCNKCDAEEGFREIK